MEKFVIWLENRVMKLGGNISNDIKYEIMSLARNYRYTGKDITNILQKNGYEITV